MGLIFIVFGAALALEGLSSYVHVVGLAGKTSLVMVLIAIALDVCKIVVASVVYKKWKVLPGGFKIYLIPALILLMGFTSFGAFGYVSQQFGQTVMQQEKNTSQIVLLEREQEKLEDRKKQIDKQFADLPADSVVARQRLNGVYGPELARINPRIEELDKEIPRLKTENISESGSNGTIGAYAKNFNLPVESVITIISLLIVFVLDPLAIAMVSLGNFLFEEHKAKLAKQEEDRKKAEADKAQAEKEEKERHEREAREERLLVLQQAKLQQAQLENTNTNNNTSLNQPQPSSAPPISATDSEASQFTSVLPPENTSHVDNSADNTAMEETQENHVLNELASQSRTSSVDNATIKPIKNSFNFTHANKSVVMTGQVVKKSQPQAVSALEPFAEEAVADSVLSEELLATNLLNSEPPVPAKRSTSSTASTAIKTTEKSTVLPIVRGRTPKAAVLPAMAATPAVVASNKMPPEDLNIPTPGKYDFSTYQNQTAKIDNSDLEELDNFIRNRDKERTGTGDEELPF